MSEPVGPSDESLKRARERVMQLAREVEQLSGEEHPPNVFFHEFLTRVVSAISARAGAVWLTTESGQLGLMAQVGLDQTGLAERPGARQVNEKLLIDVMQTGEARTLVPGGGADLPTDHVLVLSALHKEKQCVGVVELFQRTDVPEKARSGYMQFLEQMCGYASRFIEGKRRNAAVSGELKSQWWTDFEQFMLRIQRSLDEQEVADAAASDGRPLLGCDRLSIAVRKGGSTKVRAVSGQSSVNQRANLVTAMSRLARRVVEMGETLTYTGKVDGLPKQIEEPLAEFIQESGSRMVMIVPTFQSDELVREQGEEAERKRRGKKPKPTGALIIEQIAESEPAAELEQRAELLADHVGAALWNSRQHNRIFGLSLWKLMGRGLEWFHGRKLAITLAVIAAIAALLAANTLVPTRYPVDADGKLMPVEQHAVWALWDGRIDGESIVVDTDSRVESGEPMLVMTNDDLELEIRKAEADIDKQMELLQANQAVRDAAAAEGNRQEQNRLIIERRTIQSDLEIARQVLEGLLKRKEEKLTLRAPAAGRIPNFQLKQLLRDRPVRQGDHLFDVMNDEGPWHMELLVEEKRMGHILRALRERQEAGESPELEAEFVLASAPDTELRCRIVEISTRSTTDPELGTAFELIAVADPGQELPPYRIGADVTVRIYCGECTWAYRLFGDVVEFLQKYLWL